MASCAAPATPAAPQTGPAPNAASGAASPAVTLQATRSARCVFAATDPRRTGRRAHADHRGSGIAHRVGCRRPEPVSYTHLRAHETDSYLVCRLLLEKK